jgi:hypothetical protein
MDIICSKCNKRITIPEDKVPDNKVFTLICPHCRNNISITDRIRDRGVSHDQDSMRETVSEPHRLTPSIPQPIPVLQVSIPKEGIDFFDEGDKTALICDDKNTDLLKITMDKLEYKISIAKGVDDALTKLKFTRYDLIILNENFAGCSPTQNPILDYIQPMPMARRREIFVALLGQDLRTMDNMTAFLKSVNVVINIKEIQNIRDILNSSIAANERFYKVFKDALKLKK